MKRILFMLLALCICTTVLASCSLTKNLANDPISLVELLDDEGYEVEVLLDKNLIDDFADELDLRVGSTYCVLTVSEDDEVVGFFLYYEDTEDADSEYKYLKNYVNTEFEDGDDIIADRLDNLLFMGYRSIWNEVPEDGGSFFNRIFS